MNSDQNEKKPEDKLIAAKTEPQEVEADELSEDALSSIAGGALTFGREKLKGT